MVMGEMLTILGGVFSFVFGILSTLFVGATASLIWAAVMIGLLIAIPIKILRWAFRR